VFDVDPGEGAAWEFVIETALALRRMLKDDGLEPWPKLTGGKGLHLIAPLAARIEHDQARAYAKRIAQRSPQPHGTGKRSLQRRTGASGASSSITCGTAAAPRRSAPGHRGREQDLRSQPR
jgi:DNA primase